MKNRAHWKRTAQIAAVLVALAWLVPPASGQTVSGTFKVKCIAKPEAVDVAKKKPCIDSTPILSFRDEVTLAVEHAPEVNFDDAGEPNPANLVLFLEGKALPGTRASVGKSQTDEDDVTTTLLTYRITRDLSGETGRTNWKEVLVAATNRPRLTISTGLEDGPAAQSEAFVEFVRMRPKRLVLWFLVAIAGAVVFFIIAARTGVLRDKEPAGTAVTNPKQRAFSLGRVQMALWTVLTVYAYLLVWFLTGEYNATIPASVVGLMGITLTTYGTAAALDANKVQTNKEKLQDAIKKLAGSPADAFLQDEKAAAERGTMVCKTEGFFKDILTSAAGASLHRLQFIVWTLVLAVVFVVTVWNTLAMPDFDATLLGLMGITSGTYVGLKLPESKA